MRVVRPATKTGDGRSVILRWLVGRFALIIAAVIASLIPVPAAAQSDRVDNSDWMADLADDLLISEITIPGTHQSMALHNRPGDAGLSKCQDSSLDYQFMRGIRAVDIRCRHFGGKLEIHHGRFYQKASLNDVLSMVVDFLQEHPTETIIMRVQEVHWQADAHFAGRFKTYLDKIPQELIYTSDDYLEIPTIGELRGKIYIWQDFEPDSLPLFGPRWPKTCYNCTYPPFKIQADYESYMCFGGNGKKTPGGKWMKYIQPLRESAIAGQPDVLYIDYITASGAPEILCGGSPHGMAWGCKCAGFRQQGMNERYIRHKNYGLIRYMKDHQSPWCWINQREGIVMMDFFDNESRGGKYLVDLLISQKPAIPYRNPIWLSRIPDSLLISELSIPGTHQSLARYRTREDRCQILPLETQLKTGIRALEVICRHENDRFRVYSSVRPEWWEKQPAWFGATADSTGAGHRGHANVLRECVRFLTEYPAETILLRVKPAFEHGEGITRDFWETFKWYITEDGDDFGPNGKFVRYRDYVWRSDDYSTVPTLGEVRGKIVFLQDFSSPEQFGLSWGNLSVQDFPVAGKEQIPAKWDSVKVHLERTATGAPGTMYANFLSGASSMLDPRDVANGTRIKGQGMNQRFYEYLAKPRDEGNIRRCGIVMADFPGPDLIERIIDHNKVVQPR